MKLLYVCLVFLCQATWAQDLIQSEPKGSPSPGGNPYLFKDWYNGVVRYANGRVMDQFKLKFDISTNRLVMQFEGAIFPADGNVKEFVMFTKNGRKKDSLVFRKGFPAVGLANAETFYNVLVTGKATLLHLYAKHVVDQKELLANQNRRFFSEEDTYYLLEDGVMLKLPQDREDLLKELAGKPEALKEFIQARQFKLKSDEDFIQIAQKYNEILAGK